MSFKLIKKRLLFIGTFLITTTVFFSSCRKVSKSEIEKFREQTEDLSVEKAQNVSIRYTDSAILKAVINTPQLVRYPNKNEPYTEMPAGLVATFYDQYGKEDSKLSARYGINYENKKLIKLTDSVRVVNRKGEELKSEELFWDQRKKKIYTNKFVRIVRGGEEIKGDGFESNENFTKYKILHPVGKMEVKDELEEGEEDEVEVEDEDEDEDELGNG